MLQKHIMIAWVSENFAHPKMITNKLKIWFVLVMLWCFQPDRSSSLCFYYISWRQCASETFGGSLSPKSLWFRWYGYQWSYIPFTYGFTSHITCWAAVTASFGIFEKRATFSNFFSYICYTSRVPRSRKKRLAYPGSRGAKKLFFWCLLSKMAFFLFFLSFPLFLLLWKKK